MLRLSRSNTVKQNIGVWLYGSVSLLVSFAIIDNFFIHPRESVERVDKIALRNELSALIEETSGQGLWVNQTAIERSNYVLSSTYIGQSKAEPRKSIERALTFGGWRKAEKYHRGSLVEYCKGKYRAALFSAISPPGLQVSFSVKTFRKEEDCAQMQPNPSFHRTASGGR